MDLQTLEERYMRVPGMYAKEVGIWPTQFVSEQRCAAILIYSVAAFAVTTQMARVVMYCSLEILLEQLPFLCVPIAAFIKHVGYVYNYNTFSKERIYRVKEEAGVLLCRLSVATNGFFIAIIFAFVRLVPYILDFVAPLNETRPRVQMYDAYYFVKNQEDYHFFIMAYTVMSMLLGTVIFFATDTILICTVQHCCGLLALAGHRFEYSLHQLPSSSGSTKTDYKRMYRTNFVHRFLLKIENEYKLSLVLLLSASVLTFTATLLRVRKGSFDDFFRNVDTPVNEVSIYQIVHMFFLTVQEQFVIDVHEDIYRQGYEALWYNADTKTQSLSILILRPSYSPPLLTAGGIMQLNLDTFAEIVKASVSYFAVLRSV